MKPTYIICLCLSIIFSSETFAQHAIKVSERDDIYKNQSNKEAICYVTSALQRVSDSMYMAGNEKYIWVDLLIDNVIPSNYNNCIQLIPNQGYPLIHGYEEVLIKGNLAAKYYDKFIHFMDMHGYNKDIPIYNFKFQDLTPEQIFNPNSTFRTPSHNDQTKMLLSKRN